MMTQAPSAGRLWDLPAAAAIDFGASNTDVVIVRDGQLGYWSEPQCGVPNEASVRRLVATAGCELTDLSVIAVTGGHHRALPDVIDGTPVVKVAELQAIARGGQALAAQGPQLPDMSLLVVSAGSGTAMVSATGTAFQHVTGTGVGGGTLLGLGRLLLATTSPQLIDDLALEGDANAVDLGLADVVTGAIGKLPPDATAVNFGRLARSNSIPRQPDMAAALVTLVGQVIATLAVNAARAAQVEQIIVTGHLTDMASMRAVMARVGDFFGFPVGVQAQAGYATVTGALLWALRR